MVMQVQRAGWMTVVAMIVAMSSGAALAQETDTPPQEEYVKPPMLRFRPLLHRELLVYQLRGDGMGSSVPHLDHTVRALVGAPIYHGPVVTLDALVEYQFDRQHGRVSAALLGAEERALDLHRFELEFPLHLSFSPEWALDLGVRAIYSGDLLEHEPSAWLPFARLNATWRFAPDWAFLFGAVSARISSVGWLALPLLGLYYRPVGGPWQLDIFLPSRIETRWWPFESAPDVHFFVHADMRAFDWRVLETARVNRIRVDSALGVRWNFLWPLELEARVGSNLLQFSTLTPDDESDALPEQSWLEGPTFTLSAGVVVRTD